MLEENKYKNILTPGMVVKNYKEMCRLLGESIEEGNSKKSQIKEWQRHFLFEKSGQNHIVVDVYDEPLPKDDKRALGNRNKYVEHIELLLLNYLSKQPGYQASFTIRSLNEFLCLCNPNYYGLNKSNVKNQVKQLYDMEAYQVDHFYCRTRQKFNEILYSSLNNLQKRFLVKYKKTTMISLFVDGQEVTMSATPEIEKNILEVKRYVAKEMIGLESITLIYLKFKEKEFYEKVNKILLERYHINYAYTQIDIIFNTPDIIEALEEAEAKMQKQLLNEKVIDTVNQQAETLYFKNKPDDLLWDEKADPVIEWGTQIDIFKKKPFKYSEVYVESQKRLAEFLLKM